MAKNRMINTKFWDDDYTSNLDPIEKLLFLYFLSNTSTNISGIYEIPLKKVAVETGVDKEMVIKILERFGKDKKILYTNGWICLSNFIKNQNQKSPTVNTGINNELNNVPKDIMDNFMEKGYGIHTLSHLIKPNSIKSNLNIVASDTLFSLKGEIQKLEENQRRDLNIVALYLEHRKPDLQNKEQYKIALTRHLKPAKKLIAFTNPQILKALDYAKKEYKDIYTLETLEKILTK